MSFHGDNGFTAVSLTNRQGSFPAIVVCEHASRHIPPEFGDLGLPENALQSHIAWDPGAAEVSRHLSERLNAPLVKGEVSRLLYDCNRPPEAPDAIPEKSETTPVPGNMNVDEAHRNSRIAEIYLPFRECLEKTIAGAKCLPALITIHSFTPVYHGKTRKVELGILHDSDTRLADAMLACASSHTSHAVMRNQPYSAKDGVTHTLQQHGIANGLLNVMIEIRNDLIRTARQQEEIAKMLHGLLLDALEKLEQPDTNREMAG